jgi:hypothetical protein
MVKDIADTIEAGSYVPMTPLKTLDRIAYAASDSEGDRVKLAECPATGCPQAGDPPEDLTASENPPGKLQGDWRAPAFFAAGLPDPRDSEVCANGGLVNDMYFGGFVSPSGDAFLLFPRNMLNDGCPLGVPMVLGTEQCDIRRLALADGAHTFTTMGGVTFEFDQGAAIVEDESLAGAVAEQLEAVHFADLDSDGFEEAYVVHTARWAQPDELGHAQTGMVDAIEYSEQCELRDLGQALDTCGPVEATLDATTLSFENCESPEVWTVEDDSLALQD